MASSSSGPCLSFPPALSFPRKSIPLTKPILCDNDDVAAPRLAHFTSRPIFATPNLVALGCIFHDDDFDVVAPGASNLSSHRSLASTTLSALDEAMPIRSKPRRDDASLVNPAADAAAGQQRPSTPTCPVQIPKKKQDAHQRRRRKPDSISPSVAALLAITDIPRPQRRRRHASPHLTVNDIVGVHSVSEKDLSLSLARAGGPMDLLLSPPDEDMSYVGGLDHAENDAANVTGFFPARTASADSVPSLVDDSLATDNGSLVDTPPTRSRRWQQQQQTQPRRRRLSPALKSLEPVRSPPADAKREHPLLVFADGLDELSEFKLPSVHDADEQAYAEPAAAAYSPPLLLQPFKPLRSVFRSNLTASLRALRSAARSFSSINLPSIPPDDFLTRSILTIDPNVPFADERRPPLTEEMPSAELRRYLNPTTTSNPDVRASASIKMQTYKIHRLQSAPVTSGGNTEATAAGHTTSPPASPTKPAQPTLAAAVPGMRQREMRENSDFIRVAVMEMAMRRRGKLDSQKPGRARWALPPRSPSVKPDEVGPNSVPTRWIPMTY